ncbi:hypothetical protein M6B38_142295 [Iris pallida]|uniref:Uncharacterized protein n=1 Tax=Iris pallida TaxID=29817 RepID=A0AAX6FAX1_IRIPA|nr:hypothetical protein M6B38_142295 [Iris pallida]
MFMRLDRITFLIRFDSWSFFLKIEFD